MEHRGFRERAFGARYPPTLLLKQSSTQKNQLKGDVADCTVSEFTLVLFSHNFGFPQIGGQKDTILVF